MTKQKAPPFGGQAKISIISAIAKNNRAIGKDNKLLWHIKEDFLHFKKITSGHPVIMGYNTYLSIGKLLPMRTNIVLSDKNIEIPGAIVCHSIEEAIKKASAKDTDEIFFIGGASVYSQAIKLADKLYLTLVDGNFLADTFFPDYSEFDKVISKTDKKSEGYKYTFVELERS